MTTKPCEVCAAGEAKYKCPACRVAYCSAACCKKHKETPCAPAPTPAAGAGEGESAPLAPAPAPGTGTAPDASSQSPPGATAAAGEETEIEEEDEGPGLSADQLALLKTSDFVRKHLANPAIAQALTQIDAASDRTKELEKAMLDQTFASFICQSLDEVVAMTPAAGV